MQSPVAQPTIRQTLKERKTRHDLSPLWGLKLRGDDAPVVALCFTTG
jgi:hypothetical protein